MKLKVILTTAALFLSFSVNSANLNDEQIMQLGILDGILSAFNEVCAGYPVSKSSILVQAKIHKSIYSQTQQFELARNAIIEQMRLSEDSIFNRINPKDHEIDCKVKWNSFAHDVDGKIKVIGL